MLKSNAIEMKNQKNLKIEKTKIIGFNLYEK